LVAPIYAALCRGRKGFQAALNAFDVLRPCVERVSFLARVGEPVVNCRDATNRPRFVVQARLDYVRLNAKARHAARCRAAQIVKRKSGRNGRIKQGVELRLGLR
jgi:hypothetical protein